MLWIPPIWAIHQFRSNESQIPPDITTERRPVDRQLLKNYESFLNNVSNGDSGQSDLEIALIDDLPTVPESSGFEFGEYNPWQCLG
jgi:hypothetical protein